MSEPSTERLYRLLPAVYRIRDAAQGEQLRALLAVIERELLLLEHDIDGLYENWFIETCQEWIIPYIGDLLGVRGLHVVENAGIYSLRAFVANTIAYRRRKGTATMLQQLARDVTDWPTRLVEYFRLLHMTQYMNHLQPNVLAPDMRLMDQLDRFDGPFEQTVHTADVRRIGLRGKYNIPNIGIFAWRLQSYPVTRSTARATPNSAGQYTFNPLGLDEPLFNQPVDEPQTGTEFPHIAQEIELPGMLRRRALFDELEARRQANVDGTTPTKIYFTEDHPVFAVFVDDNPVPAEEIEIADLTTQPLPGVPDVWRRPLSNKPYTDKNGQVTALPISIAVDPALGRFDFPKGTTPTKVEVSYSYGFSGDVGGGPYDKRNSITSAVTREVDWQAGVSAALDADHSDKRLYKKLSTAVDLWNQWSQQHTGVGVIAILDSRTYTESLIGDSQAGGHQIEIPEKSQLLIVAADWKDVEISDRTLSRLTPAGFKPHVQGDLHVLGTAASGKIAGELVVNGLLIEGSVRVLDGNLGSLRLDHSTVVPSVEGVVVEGSQNDRLSINLTCSICGPISLATSVPTLNITESIIDGRSNPAAIYAPNTEATISGCTVYGQIIDPPSQPGNPKPGLRSLMADATIFADLLFVLQRQIGCVRFSYVPSGSRTPRRYRCQPDLALNNVNDIGEQTIIRNQLKPVFTSDHYGHPAYSQLGQICAPEIRKGAEDGSEMGVFSFLKQAQREANLRSQLLEYLPFGLETALIPVT